MVVGPWISEVGFEVLYWLPLLTGLVEQGRLMPERAVSISRGGAGVWYRDVCTEHLEIFDVFSPEELKAWNERRARKTGGQKHMSVTALDREILRRLSDRVDPRARLLHPSLMYNGFRYLWAWRTPPSSVVDQVRFRALPDPGAAGDLPLPADYVAVKAYFSSCFPPSPANRRFVRELVARLAEQTHVVLLATGLDIDDHEEPTWPVDGRVLDGRSWMRPGDNLAVQTRIIRGARALLSSYGGFSYLGPFLGVPSVCFYSDGNFNPTHFEIMRQATDALGAASFVALNVRDLPLIDGLLAAPVRPTTGVR